MLGTTHPHVYTVPPAIHFIVDAMEPMFNTQDFLKPVEYNPLSNQLNFIEKLAGLGLNWDGYGAKIPNENTFRNAKNFLGLLPIPYQKMLNTDDLSLTPYGTILMEWRSRDEIYLSIEIGNTMIGYLSETPDGQNPCSNGILFNSNEIPSEIIPVFSKVFSA